MPLLVLLLGLAGRAWGQAPCDAAYLGQARKEAQALAAVGKSKEAIQGLGRAGAACANDPYAKLWLLSDRAALAYAQGDLRQCREGIKEIAADFPASSRVKRLAPAWKSLASSYYLCGCPDIREPLCRENSWLKKGYAQAGAFRLNFRFAEEEKRSASGASYVEYRAVPSSLETLDEKGRTVQKMPLIEGDSESEPAVEADFFPRREEKDNILVADMDFDGHPDVAIAAACGNGGCCTGNHWLYVPARRRFEYSEALAGLCFAEFDARAKEVRASYRSSATEHGSEAYRWDGAKLRLIERITESSDNDVPSVKVERLVGGQLREVRPTAKDRKGARLTRPLINYRR